MVLSTCPSREVVSWSPLASSSVSQSAHPFICAIQYCRINTNRKQKIPFLIIPHPISHPLQCLTQTNKQTNTKHKQTNKNQSPEIIVYEEDFRESQRGFTFCNTTNNLKFNFDIPFHKRPLGHFLQL